MKVGIAPAVMFSPEVIVLDEPFANLDPRSTNLLKKLLYKLKSDKKVTMLISSHNLNHVTEVCERIAILEKGDIIHDLQTSENTLKELENYFAV